jgi:hypothetical protein
MLSRSNMTMRRRRLPLQPALLIIGLSASVALALLVGSAGVHSSPLPNSIMALPGGKGGDTPGGPRPGAYHYLAPEPGGPCNGCTVHVGDRFTLDLMVHSGAIGASAQQAYLTFTNSLLQNVSVSSPLLCEPDSTVAGDLSTFDATLQNEVCNGPEPCVFRGRPADPGDMAYASSVLNNCQLGCYGTFRVARVGICATAPGQAVLHWQFSPPAPVTRNTEVDDRVLPCVAPDCPPNLCVPFCYKDYVINVIKP